jgi:hypothetical protein
MTAAVSTNPFKYISSAYMKPYMPVVVSGMLVNHTSAYQFSSSKRIVLVLAQAIRLYNQDYKQYTHTHTHVIMTVNVIPWH